MKEKRLAVISIRIGDTTKKELQRIADEHRWTLSQTAAIILEEYIKQQAKSEHARGSAIESGSEVG